MGITTKKHESFHQSVNFGLNNKNPTFNPKFNLLTAVLE